MGQAYQLEESSDRYLLEDGSGVYLQEVQDVTLAITGLQSDVRAGVLRADWHLESAAGAVGPETAVLLDGLDLAAAQGAVTAESESSPDREAAIEGLATTAESGTVGLSSAPEPAGLVSTADFGAVSPDTSVASVGLDCLAEAGVVTVLGDITEALVGQSLVLSAGLLSPAGGDVSDDLVFMQRQRRFGKSTTPLVRQPYPRKVR